MRVDAMGEIKYNMSKVNPSLIGVMSQKGMAQ